MSLYLDIFVQTKINLINEGSLLFSVIIFLKNVKYVHHKYINKY